VPPRDNAELWTESCGLELARNVRLLFQGPYPSVTSLNLGRRPTRLRRSFFSGGRRPPGQTLFGPRINYFERWSILTRCRGDKRGRLLPIAGPITGIYR
jgi:hypothetical protein